MASFNILATAENAYRTTWMERGYLFRLALAPILLKLACYMTAYSMGYQDDYLKLTLFLLPALFAEGWMLSHYTRLIVLGHRWPFRPSGNIEEDIATLTIRARGVMGGLLVFVLTNMVYGVLLAVIMPYVPENPTTAEQLPPPVAFMFFLLLAFSFWGFRLIWLYIPYALNISGSRYLQALKGVGSSMPMIAVWLLSLLPFVIVMQFLVALIIPAEGGGNVVSGFMMVILMVAFDTLKNIVATAAITYGLLEIFEKENPEKA